MENIFEYLNAVTYRKDDLDFNDDEIARGYDIYMMNRFISMCDLYLPLVNEMNKAKDISKETHFRFFLTALPKRKQFFQYLKKKKDLKKEHKEYIAKYFECGKRECEMYINTLTETQIEEIIKIYEHGVTRKR